MKVYLVWEIDEDDNTPTRKVLNAVFATKRLAQNYVKARAEETAYNYDIVEVKVLDKPIN